MAMTERPEPAMPDERYPCPHIRIDPAMLSGAPSIRGHRIFASTAGDYGRRWQPEQDPCEVYAQMADGYNITFQEFLAAWCFEAGRRYGEQHNRGDQRRRRLRTIEDADAYRAKGRAEGIAEAAEYLRASGRGDWAVVLTETLAERGEGTCIDPATSGG